MATTAPSGTHINKQDALILKLSGQAGEITGINSSRRLPLKFKCHTLGVFPNRPQRSLHLGDTPLFVFGRFQGSQQIGHHGVARWKRAVSGQYSVGNVMNRAKLPHHFGINSQEMGILGVEASDQEQTSGMGVQGQQCEIRPFALQDLMKLPDIASPGTGSTPAGSLHGWQG